MSSSTASRKKLRGKRTVSTFRSAKRSAEVRKVVDADALAVFPTALGWMAVVTHGSVVRRLMFGCASPVEAVKAVGGAEGEGVKRARVDRRLIARLKTYAQCGGDDFRDVQVDLGPRTDFQRQVIEACRRIPRGKTSSYGELAAAAGYPRAARAVGTVMATNQVPLIIPCHRVLASAGRLGGYGGLGLSMKSRLLALEEDGKKPSAAKRGTKGSKRPGRR
jgi:methylated-DNA-[protein]-cysteine S-methyltransferase